MRKSNKNEHYKKISIKLEMLKLAFEALYSLFYNAHFSKYFQI